MCGICGTFALDGSRVDAAVVAAMNEALVHRGPDSQGSFSEGPIALAMRRLAIIDLQHGDQPISNENGQIKVIQNGEIYNYRELRAELQKQGHSFTTESDTEVLVHLYEQCGLSFVEKLRGMFAIALWDARNERVVIARDRFGIKPLYYSIANGMLTFASELKSMLRAPGFSRQISLDALEAFLAFNSIPAPLTIFDQVSKLQAGHLLVADRSGVEISCYARVRPATDDSLLTGTSAELDEQLRERMRDSVKAHLVADVPVGVLLSGGVDSSLITALASEQAGAQVSTFSIGFEEQSFNELEPARAIADRYGTDHHELLLRPDAAELLSTLARTFDEPFADSSALPTYLVSQLAANHVKVVLSGEGGDELFGGYYTYAADMLAPRLAPLAKIARPLVERIPSSSSKVSFEYKAKRFVRAASLPPLERHHGWKEIFSADARAELLVPSRRGTTDPIDLLRRRYAETKGIDELARLQDVDIGIYLVDDLLVKTDRASMAHSLETRVPFLDPVIAEFALALPRRQKVRGFSKKRLLRRAATPLIGKKIANSRKQGFSIPAAAWLRGELEPFAREVLAPEVIRRQGFFNSERVGQLLDAHVERREDYSRQIWSLLSFTLWHEHYSDESGPTSSEHKVVQA